MSADYGTARFKGFAHRAPGDLSDGVSWVHVVWRDTGGEWGGEAFGDFSLEDLTELVQLAGRAWPDAAEVRYVIEARLPGKEWQPLWSAPADEDHAGTGVGEEFAQAAAAGFRVAASPPLEWQLVRRTTVTHDEVLTPEGTP